MRGLIPDSVLDRPKIGFFDVVDDWFSAQTRGVTSDYLLGSNPRYAELLDRQMVEGLVSRHLDGTDRRHGRLLLSILMLEIWLSSYLAHAAAPLPARERIEVA